MRSSTLSKGIFHHPILRNLLYVLLFGILSWVLSLVGIGPMNLREIPLLICLIHINRPIYVIILCFFTLLNLPDGIALWAAYGVHVIPLMLAWICFKLVEKKKTGNIVVGFYSVFITLGYYLLVLLPLVVVVTILTGEDRSFGPIYLDLLPISSFEIISSTLVVSFYFMQFEIRKTLMHNNENLSLEVDRRTIELQEANNELISLNEELKASNESIRELNENLEVMVRERTEKINYHLNQLSKYAHMNSHEVRAPLARMLGLMQLIQHKDTTSDQRPELINKLNDSSMQLDTVIKEMNRLLEEGTDL
jgi:signal transduction histidine kinase